MKVTTIEKLIEIAESNGFEVELAKGNEPVYQFRPECDNWIDCSPVFFESWRGEKRIVYPLPPTASQIEQETAEACARVYLDTYDLTDIAEAIRSGAWKEFKKS